MHKNFGKRDWETLIRHIAGNSGNVFFTRHAEQRMKQRHITRTQVLETLRLGVLRLEPEPDLKTGDVHCRMERSGAINCRAQDWCSAGRRWA